MEEDKKPGKKTIFHGEMTYIERLDRIVRTLSWLALRNKEAYRDERDQHKARLDELIVYFRALYPKMNVKERKEHNKAQKDLTLYFRKAINTTKRIGEQIYWNSDYTDYFDEWEKHLSVIHEEKGLLMPDQKGGEDATDAD